MTAALRIAVVFAVLAARGVASEEATTLGCGRELARAPRELVVAGWRIPYETAAEVELPLDELLPFLETDDGSLGPLFFEDVAPPAWLAREYAGTGRLAALVPRLRPRDRLAAVRWDRLPLPSRRRLLVDLHRGLEATPRGRIDAVLPENVPGLRLELPSDDPRARYVSPRLGYVLERTNPSWLEAHLRAPLEPGEMRRTAFRLFPSSPSVHVHCPVPIDLARARAEGLLGAALRTDLLLRANLWAELATVIYREASIRALPRHGHVQGSAPLSPDAARQMAEFFFFLSRGWIQGLDWPTKNAFVGLRGDFYDRLGVEPILATPGVFVFVGLENRFLRRGKSGTFGEFPEPVLPFVDAFMDASREQLRSGRYGDEAARVRRWIAPLETSGEPVETAFPRLAEAAWYRTPEAFNRAWMSRAVSGVVDEPLRQKLLHESIFGDANRPHGQVAMLTFPWDRLALVGAEPDLARRVRAAQLEALRTLRNGGDPLVATRRFVWESGLFHALSETFSLDARSLPPPPNP